MDTAQASRCASAVAAITIAVAAGTNKQGSSRSSR
jgi:hypothetical protein